MEDYLLFRINELAHKQKDGTITEEEKKEQQDLRKKYIERFRSSFISQLNNTYFVDEKGNEIPFTEYNKKDKGEQK